MILIQMTGLSGAGKSTIANATKASLIKLGYRVELLDGDEYRKNLSHDLGFSKEDRIENIKRLGFVGLTLVRHDVISILAAINPYEEARQRLKSNNDLVKTVYINCPLNITIQRDPKGLYQRALLPPENPNHIAQFTGISDPYEIPENPDLVLETNKQSIDESVAELVKYILDCIEKRKK